MLQVEYRKSTIIEIQHIELAKDVMQEKLIAVVYTLRTYWNQFSVGGICKQE